MSKPSPTEIFNKELSATYDERNRRLAPIADCMHFLIRLILREHGDRSHVLCAGVGTGAEILALAESFPRWTFVGIDPSASMLEVCRHKLEQAGILDRCELRQGYVHDGPSGEDFDVVLSLLVGHFVKPEDRLMFYRAMWERLRPEGYLINTEISFDLESREFPFMLKNWEAVQSLMGATPESLATIPAQLRDRLSVLPPEETERLLRESGMPYPVRFFQAFMICGWYGRKTVG